jgi:ATP-dependent Clp protease ATP-binding subunit ClpB
VDFKNTVLIMTSNIPLGAPAGGEDPVGAEADAKLRTELLQYFKPEFVNRLDDVVRFHPLTREHISEIVDMQVARVVARVAERGVRVSLTPAARELLGDMGYDPTYGARPLRRVIQKELTDRLALALLEGELREGDSVTVDAVDGDLVLEKEGVEAGAAA